MDMLARAPARVASRFLYGTAAYWALNVALVAAEIRWHVLARLTVWDITQLRVIAPALYHAIRAHIGG
jgi:hypothetical protein